MKYLNKRGHRNAGRILALSAFAFAMPIAANAQWTATNLHPSGATASQAYGVRDGTQVGHAVIGGVDRASLWSGSAGSWVDLNPAGATGSRAIAANGGEQIGYAYFSGVGHAGRWSGTAASFVDLHPAGFDFSYCFGAGVGTQIGYAGVVDGSGAPILFHAGVWFNTAGSWVDMHPDAAGVTESRALGGDADVQVGYVVMDGAMHASRWDGTAESWVDLHPAEATASLVSGGGAGQQVGTVQTVSYTHAAVWNDTPAWVDLHPAGTYSASYAMEAFDGQQAGYAHYNGTGTHGFHAFIWSGSSATAVDLHNFLPTNKYSYSMAYGIWHDATYTYVVGFAHKIAANRDEAFMWRRHH
jgi:hypothetical protein